MGVIIKQSFWGTVIAYLGLFVGYINFLFLRAEYFDLQQIGVFSLVTANAMIISPISSFGMSSSFLKFFPSFDSKHRNTFFSFLFLLTVLGNALIVLILWLLKDQIATRYLDEAPTYINYFSITVIIILSNSFFELFFSYSRTIMKIVFPTFLRELYLRLGSLLLVFGFAFEWWNFDQTILGLGLIYGSAFVFLFIQLVVVHRFRFAFHFQFFSSFWKSDFLQFSIYSMLLAGSFAILNNASYDQITATLGLGANGIFATCFFIALVVELPRSNMAKVISPLISYEFEQGNLKEVENLYKKSSITMTVIGMLLFIGIVTNLEDLFLIIPKGEMFQAGFLTVVLVCFIKLLLMVSSFAGEIINYSKLYRYNLAFLIISAIALLFLNRLLIESMGLNGAALSYAFAILLHIILKITFVSFQFKMHPFMKSHVALLVIGVIVFILAYYFQPTFHPIIKIILRSAVTASVFTLLIYRFKISTDINNIIHSTFERFLKINLPK